MMITITNWADDMWLRPEGDKGISGKVEMSHGGSWEMNFAEKETSVKLLRK